MSIRSRAKAPTPPTPIPAPISGKRKVRRTVLAALLWSLGAPSQYVASRAGISAAHLSAIANLTQRPSDDVLARLAELLDVHSPSILLETIASDDLHGAVRDFAAIH